MKTLLILFTIFSSINCGWYSESFIPPAGNAVVSRHRFIEPTHQRSGRLCLFKNYELTSEDMIEPDQPEPLCHDYILKGKRKCDIGLYEIKPYCIQPNVQWRVNYLLPRKLAPTRNIDT
ncbi:hypothetical protein ACFFRR_002468 [Megaselia abdita]